MQRKYSSKIMKKENIENSNAIRRVGQAAVY